MALSGGVLAALIGGGVLTVGAIFGFFTLLAIAVRNGLVLIAHLQRLAQDEDGEIGPEIVLRGARDRVAPILMTALVTAVALLPMLIGGSIAGNEMLSPMAIVILGGLVTSTLLNLFIVPALYLRWPSTVPADVTSSASVEPTVETA
jgi:Cu/Ag efflux pump CusA